MAVWTAKLVVALRTYGTSDVRSWIWFAQGVRERGPIGVYGIDFEVLHEGLYNHPPLVGYYLEVLNGLAQWGMPVNVSLRAISSAADVVSGLLVFELVRRRAALTRAAVGGLSVVASPLLFLVSGYHGNTDPIFVMLVLLGTFLVVDRRSPVAASVIFAMAIGIKIVPVVVLPTIAVYLIRNHRDRVLPAGLGFLTVVAVLWVPPLLSHGSALDHNVLGYAGIGSRPWGLVRFSYELGWRWLADFLVGSGRSVIVLLCGVVPAVLTWRRPSRAVESVALSLVAFLAFSPAFGVQYLVWAAAPAYLLDVWSASVYNLVAGVFVFHVYDQWNAGLPWVHMALGTPLTSGEVTLAALVWAALISVMIRGGRRAADLAEPDRPANAGVAGRGARDGRAPGRAGRNSARPDAPWRPRPRVRTDPESGPHPATWAAASRGVLR